jgi:hypothetical protein
MESQQLLTDMMLVQFPYQGLAMTAKILNGHKRSPPFSFIMTKKGDI